MNTSELMQYLDNVPMKSRKATDLESATVTVYHMTATANVPNIRASGLKAQSSRQSYDRPAAVYFFADGEEANASNARILIGEGECTILTITIPAKNVVENMKWDGLFNVSFGGTYSAVQYLGNVPKEWIE